MIKFTHISASNCVFHSNHLTSILPLYIEAFPCDERREWGSIDDIIEFFKLHTDRFNIVVITSDNRFAGFLSYWDFDTHIYIEHLAIVEQLRSLSLGSQMIRYAMTEICPNILLEVEHPDSPQAIRRIDFYNRLGFSLHKDIPYIQPPYSPRQSPTPLMLMTCGNIRIDTPCDEIITSLKRIVYNYF